MKIRIEASKKEKIWWSLGIFIGLPACFVLTLIIFSASHISKIKFGKPSIYMKIKPAVREECEKHFPHYKSRSPYNLSPHLMNTKFNSSYKARFFEFSYNYYLNAKSLVEKPHCVPIIMENMRVPNKNSPELKKTLFYEKIQKSGNTLYDLRYMIFYYPPEN
jgi:hypothetical protein